MYKKEENGKVSSDGKEFFPAFENQNIVIILSSSNEFSIYLGVCLQSIMNNISENNNYDIIIFERGISSLNKNKLLTLKDGRNNVSIRFYNVKIEMKNIEFYINSDRISQETYYGLMAPFLLIHYYRAIIMDCDMIVKKDLAELYRVDLQDNIAGGVNDVILLGWLNDENNDTLDYYKNVLHIENPFNCVNGGLILLDFDKYRKNITKDLVLHYLNNYQLRVVDQDIFNKILFNRIKHLDVRWNHMIDIEGSVREAIRHAPISARELYFAAKKEPYVIHYASENKPWLNPELEFANDFWEIAKETKFYEILMYRMMKNIKCEGFVDNMKFSTDYKYKIKQYVKVFFPTGTKRNMLLKRIYFKLRGSQLIKK